MHLHNDENEVDCILERMRLFAQQLCGKQLCENGKNVLICRAAVRIMAKFILIRSKNYAKSFSYSQSSYANYGKLFLFAEQFCEFWQIVILFAEQLKSYSANYVRTDYGKSYSYPQSSSAKYIVIIRP